MPLRIIMAVARHHAIQLNCDRCECFYLLLVLNSTCWCHCKRSCHCKPLWTLHAIMPLRAIMDVACHNGRYCVIFTTKNWQNGNMTMFQNKIQPFFLRNDHYFCQCCHHCGNFTHVQIICTREVLIKDWIVASFNRLQ